jgi:carbamate kinase
MRIVIAVGGNALVPRGARLDAAAQREQLAKVAPALGRLARDHHLVVVHGNGPQVGMLALESDADPALTTPYPLDDLVAETQGMIGYWLQQAIANESGRPAVTLISRTLVDPGDPAFANPTKFIGPQYDGPTADRLAAEHGWTMKQDGRRWRRVVASPTPYEVIEIDLAGRLLSGGATVVLAGGGGIPVAYRGDRLVGVEAVVDKDVVAGDIAEQLYADLFVVLTDVPAVMTGFGTAKARPIHLASPEELAALELPEGSMAPKVRAVTKFVRNSGRRAAIGALEELDAIVAGTAGTQITRVRDRVLTAPGGKS